MLHVRRLGSKIQNLIIEYGDVEISIAVEETIGCENDDTLDKLEVDSIMLTHAKKGNISKLYTRCMEDLIYPKVHVATELHYIMKFIDEFNRLAG